jgi:SAM-dependent methyltransferase
MSVFGRATGYVMSLRPYSWRAIRSRVRRRVMMRARRLPLARSIAGRGRNGVSIDGARASCPLVEIDWARASLMSLGVPVETYHVDALEFQVFLREAKFPAWYHGGNGNTPFLEKALEHYVAAQLLELQGGDTYLDVGADNSPFAAIAEGLFGCRSLQLDAAYRPGVHGRFVGADVASVPLPDGSITKMAAHCAFDHFQGEGDRAFIREASRLLAPGGRFCILPLYLAEAHTNFVDPLAWGRPPALDDGASVIEIRDWGYEFTRYYSPEAFLRRVVHQGRPRLSARVFAIEGIEDIDPGCYLRLAAVLERGPS